METMKDHQRNSTSSMENSHSSLKLNLTKRLYQNRTIEVRLYTIPEKNESIGLKLFFFSH